MSKSERDKPMQFEIKKRDFDNKFVLWGYMVDPSYDPKEVNEENIPFIPQRWIMLYVGDSYNETKSQKQKFL